jgi:hypothetical protein
VNVVQDFYEEKRQTREQQDLELSAKHNFSRLVISVHIHVKLAILVSMGNTLLGGLVWNAQTVTIDQSLRAVNYVVDIRFEFDKPVYQHDWKQNEDNEVVELFVSGCALPVALVESLLDSF